MSSWNSEPEINNQRERILLGLAILFVFSNGIALGLVQTAAFNLRHLWPVSLWAVLAIGGQLLLHRYKPTHDPYLWPLVSLLLGWGILLVDRLAPNFLARQVAWVALGTAVALAVAIWPRNLRFLRQYRYTWLLGGLLLLGATFLFGVNPSGFGAQQWLRLPFLRFIYFQPSELLKLLLVVYLASYFADRQELLRLNGRHTLPYLAPLLLMWGFCMILLVWQRDLGAATLFFILFLTLLYLATGERLYVWGGLGLLALAAVFAYFAFDVVTLRVDAWWNPWPEADNRAFQIVQSLYALASGGVFGRGIGQGFPTYIPVVHSDFAFAALGEEWGAVGSLAAVACFALLAQRGLWVALHSQRPFRTYLAAGITILFSTQALLIMGGVTKLLPLTGVTLPFVSYGGSSLMVSCLMAGLLLHLSSE